MTRLLLLSVLLVSACREQAPPPIPENAPSTAPPSGEAPASRWGRDGGVLRLTGAERVELRCTAGKLRVTLPDTPAIASEERLSFGGGGEVVALVADAVANPLSAEGPVPDDLAAMLIAGPSASYGAARIGPLPPVDARIAAAFAARCAPTQSPPPPPPAGGSACRMQDGKAIGGPALRAIGTEPFWGAAIDGRCVTYSTPDDQAGTRVWTRRSEAGGVVRFTGALDGQPFALTVRPQAGCSDGMSDQRYPLAAELTVRGERRTGCALTR